MKGGKDDYSEDEKNNIEDKEYGKLIFIYY